jgi:hypothetical protein
MSEDIGEYFSGVIEKIDGLLDGLITRVIAELEGEGGEVRWPIKSGDMLNVRDAYATVFDLSDGELKLSFFDETGNEWTDILSVVVMGSGVDGAPAYYWRRTLKEMLEEELGLYRKEDNLDNDRARLLQRLIAAFEEQGAKA